MGCGLLRGLHRAYLMSYLEISYIREYLGLFKGLPRANS